MSAADIIRQFEELLESPAEALCLRVFHQARGVARTCEAFGAGGATRGATAALLEQHHKRLLRTVAEILSAADADPGALAEPREFRRVLRALTESMGAAVAEFAAGGRARREIAAARIRGRADRIAAAAALRLLAAGRARAALAGEYLAPPTPPVSPRSPRPERTVLPSISRSGISRSGISRSGISRSKTQDDLTGYARL